MIDNDFIQSARERYSTLTIKGKAVAEQLAIGTPYIAAAKHLGISRSMFVTHLGRLKEKLGVEETHAIPLVVLAAMGIVKPFEVQA